VSTPARYGGFWIRFVAVLIDGILVQVVVVPFGALMGGAIGVAGVATSMPGEGTRLVSVIVGVVLGLLGSWIYEAAMESSSLQATLGKMIFGMKVTDVNGNRISFMRATGRHFAKYLSSLILFIGYIMAGFTARKQAPHDIIADADVLSARTALGCSRGSTPGVAQLRQRIARRARHRAWHMTIDFQLLDPARSYHRGAVIQFGLEEIEIAPDTPGEWRCTGQA